MKLRRPIQLMSSSQGVWQDPRVGKRLGHLARPNFAFFVVPSPFAGWSAGGRADPALTSPIAWSN